MTNTNVFSSVWKSLLSFVKKEQFLIVTLVCCSGFLLLAGSDALAQITMPGTDKSQELKAASTLMQTLDSVLFKWVARLLAGVFVIIAFYMLKEQRMGVAVITLIAAIAMGSASSWIGDFFRMSDKQGGVFETSSVIERSLHESYV